MYQKSKFLWLLLAIILSQTNQLLGQCKLDYDETLWDSVFVDEFDYSNVTQLLNSGFWRSQSNDLCRPNDQGVPGLPAGWNTDQITLDNGLLRLKATDLKSSTLPCPVAGGATIQYKIGGIETGGLNTPEDQYNDRFINGTQTLGQDTLNDDSPCQAPEYIGFYKGMFEIRCKLPSSDKVFPAFWLYNGADEIDIMEYVGDDHRFLTNTLDLFGGYDSPELDSVGVDPDNDFDTTKNTCQQGHETTRNIENDFHTFTLVWTGEGSDTTTQLTFFFDGKEVRTETRHRVWDCPLGLLINMSVQADASFEEDELVVDYVRVYRQVTQDSDSLMLRYKSNKIN